MVFAVAVLVLTVYHLWRSRQLLRSDIARLEEAVNASAPVLVNYDSYAVLKLCYSNSLVILRVSLERDNGNERLNYTWAQATISDGVFDELNDLLASDESLGSGESRSGSGSIDGTDGDIVAGTLKLKWSKSSDSAGWLYIDNQEELVLYHTRPFQHPPQGPLESTNWRPIVTVGYVRSPGLSTPFDVDDCVLGTD